LDYSGLRSAPVLCRDEGEEVEAKAMDYIVQSYGGVLLIASLCLAVAALVCAVLMIVQLRWLKRPFRPMAELFEKRGGESALEELIKGVDENREFLRTHSDEIKRILQLLAQCYRGMGIVKYNAFEDIGGMQSYSLCLLTQEKNGFIVTNLVGRTSTRGYALDIQDGKPSRALSDEERGAFDIAMQSFAPSGG
jgi:hypothetical protein